MATGFKENRNIALVVKFPCAQWSRSGPCLGNLTNLWGFRLILEAGTHGIPPRKRKPKQMLHTLGYDPLILSELGPAWDRLWVGQGSSPDLMGLPTKRLKGKDPKNPSACFQAQCCNDWRFLALGLWVLSQVAPSRYQGARAAWKTRGSEQLGLSEGNWNRPTSRSGTPSPTSTFCLCVGYFQVLALKWKALWETDAQSYFGLDWLERSGLKTMPSCNAEELQSGRRKACYPSSRFDA